MAARGMRKSPPTNWPGGPAPSHTRSSRVSRRGCPGGTGLQFGSAEFRRAPNSISRFSAVGTNALPPELEEIISSPIQLSFLGGNDIFLESFSEKKRKFLEAMHGEVRYLVLQYFVLSICGIGYWPIWGEQFYFVGRRILFPQYLNSTLHYTSSCQSV